MNMLVSGYTSDSDSSDASDQTTSASIRVESTPTVVETFTESESSVVKGLQNGQLVKNVSIQELARPELGPYNPYKTKEQDSKKNTITGYLEKEYVSNLTFDQNFHTYQKFGEVVKRKLNEDGTDAIVDIASVHANKRSAQEFKKLRETSGDPSILHGENAYKGPWAKYSKPESVSDPDEVLEVESVQGNGEVEVPSKVEESVTDLSSEQEASAAIAPIAPTKQKETTVFHGESEFDYQGRTYLHVPTDTGINLLREPGEQTCYIPKKQIHTWTGHKKGISALRFFPNTGHLLLSGSLDTDVKIWSTYHDRSLLRTFSGHSKSIRDLCFGPDGKMFLSCAYDKTLKLWDTETGKCMQRYASGRLTHCVRFQTNPNKPTEFLAGMADKRILQFDTRTNDVVQTYEQHLGPVNSLIFIEGGERFVSTSEDSSMRYWEYGTPIPIKYIADPTMHSMPRIALRPNGKSLLCQSLDNCMYVYSAVEKYRQNRKKAFKGYSCSGYALEVGFSPDGRFVFSGDSSGNACFWDWKTCKLLSKLPAHKGPLQSMAFHPQETSKVATSSVVDNVIKYWD
ncbi:splicing factor Prp17 [Schizosaccharomyces japonicus yFS275]|uniref:Pre-mRNA-processing factor 17 n=1 Tax=Schizosaccharomyces japonicus (strain yFS275 / FY16936) TaxID=402676 RepID=B6JW69_SCHJY|nr:splicing factor Prp17 [Schizosaccharomyces japonicus yFS275]EEB05620.2 splicing factor Prp17 [Schizosaccharomyces japonicus yFS275]